MKQALIDSIPAVTTKTSWLGALLAGTGALTLNEWLAVGGFVMAVMASLGGLALNAWFKRRRDIREQRIHELREILLRSGKDTLTEPTELDE